MPDLALSSPASSPAAIVAVSGNAVAAVSPSGDMAPASPFATVLQEQLAAQLLMPVPAFVELPAVDTAAEAPADAILPLLLGMTARNAVQDPAFAPSPAEPAADVPAGTMLQPASAMTLLNPMPVPAFVELPAVDTAADAPVRSILPQLAQLQQMPHLPGMTARSADSGVDPLAPADSATNVAAGSFLPQMVQWQQIPPFPGMAARSDSSGVAEDEAEAGTPQLAATDSSVVIPLALPAMGIQPGDARQHVGAGDTAQYSPAATVSPAAAAILAATTDAGDGSAIATNRVEEVAAAATENPAPRAEATQHVQPASTRMAEQAVRIEAPLGSRHWDGEFANHLAWMVGKNEQRADLVLTPPHLGRIEVSVSVNGEQATAIFTSASATVRDAIENALPRLREVLQESGINLGQAQVGSESPQQSPPREENRDNRGNAVAADTHAMPAGFAKNSPTDWQRGGRGIIDVFA